MDVDHRRKENVFSSTGGLLWGREQFHQCTSSHTRIVGLPVVMASWGEAATIAPSAPEGTIDGGTNQYLLSLTHIQYL